MAFDTNNGYAVPLRREDGLHKVKVRWPTDEEWIDRYKNWNINISNLGRGISETQIESFKADLALYQKIREEESLELVAEEAQKVIEVISRCEVTGVSLGLDEAVVDMTIVNGMKVKHTLRLPTTAEVTQFQRSSARVMDLPHGRQTVRTNLNAGSSLYDKCHRGHEGYVNGVPITHRDSALRAVITECEREAQPGESEDF